MNDQLLTRNELARVLRVSPETVTRWARLGTIPEIRLSAATRRFDLSAVLDKMQARKGNPDEEET